MYLAASSLSPLRRVGSFIAEPGKLWLASSVGAPRHAGILVP